MVMKIIKISQWDKKDYLKNEAIMCHMEDTVANNFKVDIDPSLMKGMFKIEYK